MIGLLLFAGFVVVCFSFVLLRGAPYLPTLDKQVKTALDLADLKPGQTLLELGCGDGKVLMAAADRGWNAVGYELNPLLALVAWLRTRRYKGANTKGKSTDNRGKVTVVWGDFWTKQWPEYDAIFVFLLDSFMPKLNTKIVQYTGQNGKSSNKPIKLVSFAFQVPDKQPKVVKDGLYLYEYK